jgi:hypothetical protein
MENRTRGRPGVGGRGVDGVLIASRLSGACSRLERKRHDDGGHE